ncbi:MAG: hypothetical protein WC848_06225 [Parcubacteria group bacterium]|jgi:hypothetical protein
MTKLKLKPKLFFCFIVFFSIFGLAKNSHAATYYIDYSNGSDTNNGTSTSTPWKLAPGMRGCSVGDTGGNCNAKRVSGGTPGDRFIFKGGVTWPRAALSFNWYFGSGTTANPIYFGVDKAWYAGGAWSRPVMDAEDNEPYPSPENYYTMMAIYGDGFVVDNLEFKGLAQLADTNPIYPGMLTVGTSIASVQGIEVKNCYFHGWSHGGTAVHDNMMVLSTVLWDTPDMNLKIHDNVWDGSDTTKDMALAYKGSAGHFYNNYVGDMSNMYVGVNEGYMWGNSFINIGIGRGIDCTFINGVSDYFSFDCTTHGNTDETYGTHYGYYNNYSDHVGGGANLIYYPEPSGSTTVFNNVVVDDGNQTMQLGALYMTPSNTFGYNIFNNTFQVTATNGTINGGTGGGDGSRFSFAKIQNNHIISSPIGSSINMSNITTTTTQDHNLDQTAEVALAAGYLSTQTHPYSPQASNSSTVNSGTVLSLICSGLSDVAPSLIATACLSDTTLGVTYDAVNHAVTGDGKAAILRGASWDIGAYEYATGTSDTTPPTAPSGLNVD